MSILSKALIIGTAALLSTSAASAQTDPSFSFRYDRAASVEQNYEVFQRTAKRACESQTLLMTYSKQRECRNSLVSQAVAATKLGSFVAYHASRSGEVGETAALARR